MANGGSKWHIPCVRLRKREVLQVMKNIIIHPHPVINQGITRAENCSNWGVDASSYTEYDIYAYDPSVNRGPERIVVDNNNRVYYTNDHYRTFWRMMFVN